MAPHGGTQPHVPGRELARLLPLIATWLGKVVSAGVLELE